MSSIEVNHVYLDYRFVGIGSRSLKNHILGAATGELISVGMTVPIISALRDINFFLEEGDRLGLVGHNGAGKFTLLKVLAGIYQPTLGSMRVKGRVVSTLNISLDMEPEATGLRTSLFEGFCLA